MHIKELLDLSGKTAVVTGGRGLYGAAICEGLAQAGAQVIVASRNGDACAQYAQTLVDNGHLAAGMALDLGDDQSIERFTNAVIDRFLKIDVLVNNAVTREGYSGLDDITRQSTLHTLDVNIAGTMLLTKAVVKHMKAQKSGSIINISSIQGMMGPHFPYYEEDQSSPVGYTFEKWGLVGFTKWLCTYYGAYGIRANCISPGGYDPALAQTRPTFFKTYLEHTPLKKWAEFDDIKGPVVFLASEAARYVTGVNLPMDGGFTVW
ncbi:SDR family oxidoreductase [Christensenellaceae bacterium OttesenSCG-928-M15]|nr:SDR family oxidoreductase [Christensenellaceae bacterium OttesenSCG-928-M15]